MEAIPINRETIATTYALIRPHVRRTPVMEVEATDFGLEGRPLVFKLELLQHTGSFKPRGALASLLSLPIPPAGVVAVTALPERGSAVPTYDIMLTTAGSSLAIISGRVICTSSSASPTAEATQGIASTINRMRPVRMTSPPRIMRFRCAGRCAL